MMMKMIEDDVLRTNVMIIMGALSSSRGIFRTMSMLRLMMAILWLSLSLSLSLIFIILHHLLSPSLTHSLETLSSSSRERTSSRHERDLQHNYFSLFLSLSLSLSLSCHPLSSSYLINDQPLMDRYYWSADRVIEMSERAEREREQRERTCGNLLIGCQ